MTLVLLQLLVVLYFALDDRQFEQARENAIALRLALTRQNETPASDVLLHVHDELVVMMTMMKKRMTMMK